MMTSGTPRTYSEILDSVRESEFFADIPLRLAVSASSGTSHTPEQRGAREVESYVQTLTENHATFIAAAQKSGTLDLVPAEFERYRAGLRKRWIARLASESRCVSWFIAGPSNFPARRMQKRSDIAHKRLNELLDYRTRAVAAILRTLQPELAPIMSGDSNAGDRLAAKLAEHEALQVEMKAINAAHARFLKNPGSLDSAPFSDSVKARIRNYVPAYSWEPHPYPPYRISNNNAEIRRIKARMQQVATAQATPESEAVGTAATVSDCPAENRVRIAFPGKPDEATRAQLKKHGFRWTPSLGVWQAYRNTWSMQFAQRIAGVAAVQS